MKLFVGAKALIHFKGKVLLIRESEHYADGTKAGKWDVPGGRIESEEEVREGLVREVKEESGLHVTPGTVLGVYDSFLRIGEQPCHIVRVYFLCEAKTDDITLSSDHDAYEWVDPKDVKGLALVGDIEELLREVQKHI